MSYHDLSDEELQETIMDTIKEDGRVRTDFMELEIHHGRPVLSGRVGTDEELQAVDEIMTDVLEMDDYENTIWVDDTLSFEPRDGEEEGEAPEVDEEEEMDEESYDEDEEE